MRCLLPKTASRVFSPSTLVVSVIGVRANLTKFFGLNPLQQHVSAHAVEEKDPCKFENVISHCFLRSGARTFYSELVHQCSRDVPYEKIVCVAAGQIDVQTQRQRGGHDDLIFIQLGHVNVKCLA